MPKELQKLGLASEQRTDTNPGLPKVVTFQDPKGTTIELFREWSYVGNGQQVLGVGALKPLVVMREPVTTMSAALGGMKAWVPGPGPVSR